MAYGQAIGMAGVEAQRETLLDELQGVLAEFQRATMNAEALANRALGDTPREMSKAATVGEGRPTLDSTIARLRSLASSLNSEVERLSRIA